MSDRFERRDANQLGQPTRGSAWRVVSGIWGVRRGHAASIAAANGVSLVLTDTGTTTGDFIAQSTVIAPQEGTGLAFRCRDASNCWTVESVAKFGTWNVAKIVNGKIIPMGNLGPAPTNAGTTVSVRAKGRHITFYVNGQQTRDLEDTFLIDQHTAGLVVTDGPFATSSRWLEFIAGPLGAQQ